ncbi:MAG: hypothetical protein ACXACC_07000 [Promethearchaeota archaeon]|jgi:hypothetical protein
MLFQGNETLIFILGLILGTIVVALIMFIAVLVVVSKTKASDKKFLILLLAFIGVLVIPIIVNAIMYVLNVIGNGIAAIRDAIDNGGQNFLTNFGPIIFFLLLLVLTKFLLDVTWDHSLWISLLTLFILYIIYSLVPELYNLVPFG